MDTEKKEPNIAIQITMNFKDIDLSLPGLKKLVRAICNRFKLHGATVSIAIVDNAEIRKVNKQFLNSNHTTDCLSFDLSDDNAARTFELVVNGEKAVKEAALQGHTAEVELALYITHSLLHNFGFDDFTQELAKKMHQTENEILEQQGYGLVY